MYAGLVAAGVSQVWDMLAQRRAGQSDASTNTATPTSSTAAPGTTGVGGADAKIGADLKSLLLDLQSDQGGTSMNTNPAASGARPAGHHHHHHAASGGNAQQQVGAALSAYAQQSGTAASASSTSVSV